MAGLKLGLAARLFATQLLVLAAAAVTLSLVAAAVGPALFHVHLHRAADGEVASQVRDHAEQAFRVASALSVTIAVAVAVVVALAVSAVASRRLSRPVAALAAAATDVAESNYGVRVAPTGLGTEFDALTSAFNALAERLQATETTRRRLLSDLAHEMRTPVATLEACAEGLADGVVAPDEETLSVILMQTVRLRRLVEDIAAVSRAEEHQLELHLAPAPPAALVNAAVAAVADHFAAKGVRLVPEVPPDLPPVLVDADRLGQVLGNLLDNALRSTPRNGVVQVSARVAIGGVEFAVADTGDGIAPEHLPHVFERFYRVDEARDREHGGSGIGLAITRALVEAHGGRVRAESGGPGTGATFTFRLPLAADGRT